MQARTFVRELINNTTRATLLPTLVGGLVACGGSEAAPVCTTQVTYTQDVRPIVEANCLRCHSSTLSGGARNGAPPTVNFDTVAGARARIDRMLVRLDSGTMPADAPGSVPPADIEVLRQWRACGLVE